MPLILAMVIPLQPITKKNHQEIVRNKRTGQPMIIQNQRYLQYERDFISYIKTINFIGIAYLKKLFTRSRLPFLLRSSVSGILPISVNTAFPSVPFM